MCLFCSGLEQGDDSKNPTQAESGRGRGADAKVSKIEREIDNGRAKERERGMASSRHAALCSCVSTCSVPDGRISHHCSLGLCLSGSRFSGLL